MPRRARIEQVFVLVEKKGGGGGSVIVLSTPLTSDELRDQSLSKGKLDQSPGKGGKAATWKKRCRTI